MKEYRLYEFSVGSGVAINCVDQFSATDQEAIERAKARVKDKPIELWQGAHRVARFDPKG